MASVTLGDAIVSLASDPTQTLTVVLTGLAEDTTKRGEVRWYAGGRRRSITRAGTGQMLRIDAELADRIVAETLEGWVGQVVLLRDTSGRKRYGTFMAVDTVEIPGNGGEQVDVGFTLTAVTFSEVV